MTPRKTPYLSKKRTYVPTLDILDNRSFQTHDFRKPLYPTRPCRRFTLLAPLAGSLFPLFPVSQAQDHIFFA
jgi:hypothetical protein